MPIDENEKISRIGKERCRYEWPFKSFDDIGVTNISDYDSNLLYYWINHRTDYSLSCIYTSNLTPNKLKQVIDERIYSRIINYSKLIEITDGDNRKNDNTVTGA